MSQVQPSVPFLRLDTDEAPEFAVTGVPRFNHGTLKGIMFKRYEWPIVMIATGERRVLGTGQRTADQMTLMALEKRHLDGTLEEVLPLPRATEFMERLGAMEAGKATEIAASAATNVRFRLHVTEPVEEHGHVRIVGRTYRPEITGYNVHG